MTLTGAIHTIFPAEKYGSFEKKPFWLKEINVKYPNVWCLEMWHDDGDVLIHFKESDVVQCEIEIKGRLYSKNGRDNVINILRCIGIKKV